MRGSIYFCLLIFFATLTDTALRAQQWKVTGASTISFEVQNFKVNTVSGSLEMPLATFDLDVNAIEDAQFTIEVKAESIKSGLKKRDENLLDEDFFHAEKYPYISFTSQSIAREDGSGRYLLEGHLKIKTFEKSIAFPFTLDKSKAAIVLDGQFVIKRKDFGLGIGYGSFTIGEEVKVKLNIVLEKA